MDAHRFEAEVPGGTLVGTVEGDGTPLLMLHGGPGLSAHLLDGLVTEFRPGYRVALYQQRGLTPSTARAPYDVAQQVQDVGSVLDALGWETAVVLGVSWGGHLVLHALAAIPDRLRAAVVVDPLGGVGDGGAAEFEAAMNEGAPVESRARAEELDRRAVAGEGTEADALEAFTLVWPAYFADPSTAPPVPDGTEIALEAYAATWASVQHELPGLAARLAGAAVPTVFVHGGSSPMPLTASADTAAAIGAAASVVVVPGSGHFVWHENPGAVRAAVDRLLAVPPGA